MPFDFKEVAIAALMPVIKSIGKYEFEQVLQNIQAHNTANVYENTLKSLHSNFKLLKEVALKSKTKIDDGIIDLVLEAVQEAADEDGVKL